MRHLPHSVDYANADDILDELDNLSFDEVKQIMRDIIQDNGTLTKITERATIALDQYKQLVSLVDGIIIDDVMDDEVSLKEKAKNSIAQIFLRLIFSMKNTSYWLMILSDFMEKYASKDKGIHNLILVLKGMSKGILSASRQLKYKHPTKRKKSFLRNLEKPKEKNGGRKLEKRVSTSSPVNLSENEDSENGNAVQNDSEMMDEEPDESILVDNEVFEEEDAKSEGKQAEAASDNASAVEVEAEKSDEELEENIPVEPSADASNSDTNEGEKKSTDRCPREKKNEKTFGISYFKTENLFRNGVVESNKAYQSISKRRNKTSPSSAFQRKRNSFKYNVNKNSQSSLGESENSHLHRDSETVSKGPRRYSRKRTLSSKEEDTNVNGLGQSENDALESMPKRQRQSNSSSNRGGVTESDSKGRRKSRKDSFNAESKSSTQFELPKKRGRKRKVDILQEKLMKDRDGNDYSLKYACVHLSNVLDDPSVQHYADVMRMSHRKKKENTKLKDKQKKSRDKVETDENSLGKETNETEVEWSVLDAVSDEDEKDNNNEEGSGEVNSDNDEQASDNDEQASDNDEQVSDNNEQVSDSEADQEQVAEDNDQEQPDEEELETNSVETKQTDERCHSAGPDESSNHSEPLSETKQCTESSSNHPSLSSHEESDSERKNPKSLSPTPSSHHISSPEVFHTEDENDAEAESVKSDEEGGEKAPSSASEPSKYGKKGPRTPSPSPMLCNLRGPRTPPGLPEVSEDEENAYSSD